MFCSSDQICWGDIGRLVVQRAGAEQNVSSLRAYGWMIKTDCGS